VKNLAQWIRAVGGLAMPVALRATRVNAVTSARARENTHC
jgi:hypothetical protein